MRYDTRALAFSTPTSPVIGLSNLPAGNARLLQTVTSSDVGREATRRFAATIPAAGNDSRGAPPREGGEGGGGERPNTWLWIAGGAAALGALLLLRK